MTNMNLKDSAIYRIKPILPQTVKSALDRLDEKTLESINELRLRSDGICTLTIGADNCVLTNSGITKDTVNGICVSPEEMDSFIFRLCKGSVYSYEPTLRDGYISRFGIRVGISGVYSPSAGNFTKIKSANIRLPRHIPGCSADIIKYIKEHGFPNSRGILICSSPGVGKTTLLRDLAVNLSSCMAAYGLSKFYRVCVIDERSEIFMETVFSGCACDFITGMPKHKGMETATRVLSAEVMICDEIGSADESHEILHARSGGVMLIASVHANSLESALERPHIKMLLDEKVFGAVYTLERRGEKVTGTLNVL